jgi:hypothetical protein
MSEPTETAPTGGPVLTAKVVAPAEPRWLVLVMLFLLMGALAVPMLWRSPYFSRTAKVVLAGLAIVQTVVVLAILVWVIGWFIHAVSAAWASR